MMYIISVRFRCSKCRSLRIASTGKWRGDKSQYLCIECGHIGWSKSKHVAKLLKRLISKLTVIYVLDYCGNCGSHMIYFELGCCAKCGYIHSYKRYITNSKFNRLSCS